MRMHGAARWVAGIAAGLLVGVMLAGGAGGGEPIEPAPGVALAWETPPPPPARLMHGLIGWYRADAVAADGRLPDRSGSDVASELSVRATSEPSVRIRDGALVFGVPVEAGVPGVFSAGPARGLIRAIKRSGTFTLEAWVRAADAAQRGPARVVSLSRDYGMPNIMLGQDGSRLVVRLRTSGAQGVQDWGSPEEAVRPDTWQHVAVTFDGETTVLYLDGEAVAQTDAFAGNLEGWDETFSLALGNEVIGGREWRGRIRMVAIYEDALTPRQVQEHFALGSAPPRSERRD